MKKLLFTGSSLALIGSYVLFRELPVPTVSGPPYQRLPQKPYSEHPNQHFLTTIPRSICVIGGGSAGLETAKALSQQGFQVEVLEKGRTIGGVWAENYDNAGLQGTFPHFEIPDFPWPSKTSLFPKLPEVLSYLISYSEHFHLNRLISFNSEVLQVTQQPDSTWTITLSNGTSKSYDFLILCTGQNFHPNTPSLPGLSSFQGKVLHSSEVRNSESLFPSKKVVVVGGGKSACDILSLAYSQGAASVTGVMQNMLWSGNRTKLFYGREIQAWLTCRLAGVLNPAPYEEKTWVNSVLRSVGSLYWKLWERKLAEDMPEEVKPKSDLRNPRVVIGRDEGLFENIKKGLITIIKGSVDSVVPQGLMVKDTLIPADILILATGFKPMTFGLAGKEDTFWLYRGVITPQIKNFAVVGLGKLTYTHLKCSLQAAWLCDVLRGTVILPPLASMKAEVKAFKSALKQAYGTQAAHFAYVWSETRYYDSLLRDMHIQTRRKPTLFADFLEPCSPHDYKSVLTHRA